MDEELQYLTMCVAKYTIGLTDLEIHETPLHHNASFEEDEEVAIGGTETDRSDGCILLCQLVLELEAKGVQELDFARG